MIDFSVDQDSQQRFQELLHSLGPRLIAEVQQALNLWLYQGAVSGIQKYFAGSGPRGGPTSTLLTSRSGALVASLLLSSETGVVLSSATQVAASFGSSLPYARIQEYGGVAGRSGPFKKTNGRRPYLPPRPYLQPIFEDLQAALPDALQQAVKAALGSQ